MRSRKRSRRSRDLGRFRLGIAKALIGVDLAGGIQNDAIVRHPDRFFGCLHVDPNGGMAVVRAIQEAHDRLCIKGVSLFPSGCNPPVPIDDKRMYPVYAKCAELGNKVGAAKIAQRGPQNYTL